jgi:hypothetical protein
MKTIRSKRAFWAGLLAAACAILAAGSPQTKTPDFRPAFIAAGPSQRAPSFRIFSVDELGRVAAARCIFYPMLESYAAGDFQGFCDNGKSKDWRDWKGGCQGYEGLLTDGYLPLLCVLDDVKAKR